MNEPKIPVTAARLAAYSRCSEREARRYLGRRHGAAPVSGVWELSAKEVNIAYDHLKQIGRVVSGRAAYSAGAASLANSGAQLKSKREK